jgi:asparagine synthase (glutamine-hydrolysing)
MTTSTESLLDDPVAHLAARSDAFAVAGASDSREVLGVDRFAIRTQCYRNEPGPLQHAERADALARPGEALDLQALFDYLYFHAIPSPRTIFRDVSRVEPGHAVVQRNGRREVLPYWRPGFEPARAAGFKTLRDEFRALLREAVARTVDRDRPACFLSGGTDSSTVAGMIREATGTAPATYSIGFEASGYDEMEYARIAARHFGTQHHEYYVTPEDLVRHIPDVARSFDQPFGNSSVLPAFCCARMARDDGVSRLLAGDGGDELFGGNARYAKQRVFGWYGQLPAPLRHGLLEPLLLGTGLGTLPLARKGRSYIEQAQVPMPQRLQTYNLLERLGINEVLAPAFRAQVDVLDPLRQQQRVWDACDAQAELDRNLAFDWRYTLAESDLPKVRMATQLAGVDVDYPLLDGALVDFSMRLPTRYKLKGLKLRWFFKEALRGFLPDAIISKPKHGFGLPFGVWASQHPGLSALATDSLRSFATRGVVQPAFIDRLLREQLPAHPGYYGEMVWILLMLEQWLQGRAPDFRVPG